jgi:hypothetical protein
MFEVFGKAVTMLFLVLVEAVVVSCGSNGGVVTLLVSGGKVRVLVVVSDVGLFVDVIVIVVKTVVTNCTLSTVIL